MRRIDVYEFLELLKYRPKFIGKELVDPVRFIEFRTVNCYSASIEFGTRIDYDHGGQYFYFEAIDFRNYDTSKGNIITANRRYGVINTYLNNKNMNEIASKINDTLKNIYRKTGPIWEKPNEK